MLRNEANDGLGEMDVEVVANDIPPCVGGGAAQQGVEKTSKVLLGPGVADHPGDFADCDIETGDQSLRAVAAILEFAPLDLARLHRQPRRDALQARPSAAHRRAAPTRIGRQAPAATVRANTAPSSATRRVPARSRGRQYCRRHAKSCELATPTVVRSNGLAPALPALHGAQAKQSPDRRPARASRLPLSASD